ncbi:hypothetical protein Mettu_1637, partial [Methylobacter tundripaludum SV96]
SVATSWKHFDKRIKGIDDRIRCHRLFGAVEKQIIAATQKPNTFMRLLR